MRLLPILLLLCAATVEAQVYRWVDAKGTVHNSNSPPPAGVSATKLDIDTKVRTWTYLPTSADPFTTTILVGGRVGEVARVRRF